jgi:hypothetical protein
MAEDPGPKKPPARLAPRETPAEAVERILPRRLLALESGDVVITQERLPRVNPATAVTEPQWWFRVRVHPEPYGQPAFTSLAHAASHAEQLAADRRSRVMFLEDDVPTLLADYRRRSTTPDSR